jgi:NAD(P)-dependent dehydrogenase (short-subunit alcohol dehydrogenase family)
MPAALITGASRGFGRAIAEALVREGWDVVIDARDAGALDAAATALRAASPSSKIVAIAGDVTDADHRSALADAVTKLGRLDLLLNNASSLGVSPLVPLTEFPIAVMPDVFRTNIGAPLLVLQAVLPQLRASAGVIVNISSDAAVEAYEGWGLYGASKAALDQMTRVLAVENPDLRFYAFDPGDMRTQMHQDAYPGEDISDRPLPESVAPALLRLLAAKPASGRYTAAQYQETTT